MGIFITITLIFTVLINLSSAQLCKNYETQKDFDVKKYLGSWYDIEKTFFPGQMDKTCPVAVYSLRVEDDNIDVLNQDISEKGYQENTTGIAYYKDANDKSKLTVKLGKSPEANYWILDTDYNSYSLVWCCNSFGGRDEAITFILSRKHTLDSNTIAMLKDKLTSLGIAASGFTKTNQTDCPW